jgi:hypothetical protein
MPGFVPDVVGNYLLTLVLTDSTGPASTQTFTLPVTCAASGALAVDDAVAHLAALSATQVVPLVNLKTGGPTPNFTLVHSTLPDSDTFANKNLNVPFYLGMPVQLAANVHDAGAENTAACPGGFPETIAYQWALANSPPGSIARLINPGSATPSFYPDVAGEYDVQLTLSDSAGHVNTQLFTTVPATTVPTPRPLVGAGFCGGQAPQAKVALLQPAVVAPGTGPAFVGTGSFVQLDASKTVDPDNTPLVPGDPTTCGLNEPISYRWRFIASPAGTAPVLSSDTISNPTFTASVTGQYGLRLTATDGSRTGIADRIIQTSAADATKSTIVATPPTQTVGQLVSLTVTANDINSNPIAGLTVSLSSDGTTNTFAPANPTGITDGNGTFTVTLTSTKAETKHVSAQISGTVNVAPIPVTFNPDNATHIVLQTDFPAGPPVYTSRVPIPDKLLVAAHDQFENTDTNFNGSLTLSFVDKPGTPSACANSTLAVNAPVPALVSGVATYSSDVVVDIGKVAQCNGFTLKAHSGALGDTPKTSPFNVAVSAVSPAPPTGLSAVASVSGGLNVITLQWTQTPDNTLDHYDVYRGTGPGFPPTTAGTFIAQPNPCGGNGSCTVTFPDNNGGAGLSNGTTYFYSVTAANVLDVQSAAITASATTAPPAPPDFAGQPAYSATASTQFTWTVDATATQYTLTRTGNPSGTINVAPTATQPIVDSAVVFGRTYSYTLTATGTGGSHVTSALSLTLRPAIPAGLTATAKDFSEIDLSWSSTTGATAYGVSRGSAAAGPFTALQTVNAPAVATADFAVIPSTPFFYVVNATNSAASTPCAVSPAGNGTCTTSPNSASQSATPPAATAWTAASSGLFGGSVRSFAQDGTTLIAGTGGLGVYASTDAAAWTSENDATSGIASARVLSLVAETVTAQHVALAGTNGGGVLKTNLPFAATPAWAAANGTGAGAIGNLFINVLGVDQLGNVYAGTQAGLFKTTSTDLGATTWTRIASSLPASITALFIVTDQNFFVGSGTQIFATINGGGTMTSQNDFGASAQVNGIAVSGANEFVATAKNVFMSANSGAAWGVASTGTGSGNETSLAFDATANRLYVGEDTGGVYSATPPGSGTTLTFSSRSGGLPCAGLSPACPSSPANGVINAIAIKGGTGNTLYAGTGNGSVFRTPNITSGTGSWASSSSGIPSVFVNGIAAALESSAPTLSDEIAITNENVFKLAHGASTWSLVLVPPTTRINAVASNSASGRVWVGMNWTGTGNVYTINYTTGTPSWAPFSAFATAADVTALVDDAGAGPTTYVGTTVGHFIASCVGTTGPTCTTFANPNSVNTSIHALALDKNANAFAGTDSGLILLSGGNWSVDAVTGAPSAAIRSLAVQQASTTAPLVLFAGTDTNVQLRTTSSWTVLAGGLTLSSGSSAQTLVVDPARITTVMVGSTKDSIQRSPDSGTTWYPFSGSVTNPNVTALTFSAGVIYAGTSGSGVFTNPNQ